MLATPKQEFPEFPAALSLLMLLTPEAMRDALGRRAAALEQEVATQAADLARESAGGLPRIASLEGEYVRTMTTAELAWVRGVLDDLDAGRLAWSPEELLALAGDEDS
jgi:hypothetical protein